MKRPWRDLRGQRGFSLIELMFTVGIAGLAIGALVRFSFYTKTHLSRQEAASDLFTRNARIGSNLRSDLQSSIMTIADYGGNPDMSALRNLITSSLLVDHAPLPVPFSVPAKVTSLNQPDLSSTASANWGNELIYLARLKPLTFTAADHSFNSALSGTSQSYRMSRCQLVYVYLTQTNTVMPGMGPVLRLVQWRSAPYIIFNDIDQSDPLRLSAQVETAMGLPVNTGFATYDYAFDYTGSTPAGCFVPFKHTPYDQVSGGVTPTSLAQASWAYMDEYDNEMSYSARPGVDQGRISRSGTYGFTVAPTTFSLAYDSVSPTSHPELKVNKLLGPGGFINVPQYAKVDSPVAGFPGGFEVAITGVPKSREIYIRHVVMSTGGVRPGDGNKAFVAHEAFDDIAIQSANPNF